MREVSSTCRSTSRRTTHSSRPRCLLTKTRGAAGEAEIWAVLFWIVLYALPMQ